MLGLTDENFFFEEEWLETLEEEGFAPILSMPNLAIYQVISVNVTSKMKDKLSRMALIKQKSNFCLIEQQKTELRLIRTRFYCKECQSTFNDQTNLVDENCYLSKKLKVQIALELSNNITRKEITNCYFVSDVTVLRVLHTCLKRTIPVLMRSNRCSSAVEK